ncbi:MAG TPA: TIGR03087 family PEP-CTERM/XrtA system glycosyltransferase, partial [Candidatus Eisenbacteria bacterium]|nr:TIGR03087 family PEP-CTERM/XrtA system glycosyltransferase [Candidatus Eisenbacteria bacterium]
MNILYLCHRIPFPPDKGDKIRSFHQIEALGARHRVHVATFLDSPEDEPHVASLRERCAGLTVVRRTRAGSAWGAGVALLTGSSISVGAFASGSLHRAVEETARRTPFDAAFVFSSAMAPYAPTGLPRIIDFVDVDSEKWRAYADRSRWPQRWLYSLEADRLLRHDAEAASRFDHAIFISDAEAEIFRKRGGGGRITVLSNGTDTAYYRPPPHPSSGHGIVFVGMMNYPPNVDAVVWFAREILPIVQRNVPQATFTIVGRDPSAPVRALDRVPGVRVTGGVPDVRPFLAEAGLAVAPFRVSRGLQNKILEAMASGLPVVGTPLAFQAIPATAADGIDLADTAAELATAVSRRLVDPERAARGLAARRYVERNHRWAEHGAALEHLLADSVQRHQARGVVSTAGARTAGG